MVHTENLQCGCCIYVDGAGMAKKRCQEGQDLDTELREAFEAAAFLDGSRPGEHQRVFNADHALVEHDNEWR